MKVKYVGPSDEVEILGQTCQRNHSIEIDDAVAGHAPEPRLHAAMAELVDAMAAADHYAAVALRAELAELDFGEGLLAQHETWVAVTSKTKEPVDPKD